MKNKVENTTQTAEENLLLTLTQTLGTGGIEAQEARGTQQLAESSVLPSDGLVANKTTGDPSTNWAKKCGIKILGLVANDPLFVNVELPAGWRQQCTDHGMHNDLLDDKGRRRAGIFYKAAFYDRRASIRPEARFHPTYGAPENFEDRRCWPLVTDGGKEIWRGAILEPGPPPWDHDGKYPDSRQTEKATDLAEQWLVDNGYPDYCDPAAYWE